MKEEYQFNCIMNMFLLDLFRLTKFQNDEGTDTCNVHLCIEIRTFQLCYIQHTFYKYWLISYNIRSITKKSKPDVALLHTNE